MSQFDELPEGWVWAKLSEIGELNRGKSKHRPRNDKALYGGIYPFIQTGDVRASHGLIKEFSQTYSELGLKQSRLWPQGTLCITIAANIAETAILGIDACFPDSIVGFLPDTLISDVRFVEYFIRTAKNNIAQLAPATAQKNINLEILGIVEIPLPPVNEQRRIVEKIDALTVRSRKARAALDEIPALLDQFRQSVLAAAFRGDLTADWRAQNPDVEPAEALLERISVSTQNPKQVTQEIGRLVEILPQGWTWTKLKTIIPHVQAGKNFSCPEVPVNDETVGMVKISAVTWGRFNPRETKTVVDESKIDPSLFIKRGDFLISRANTAELVGASVIVDEIQHKIMLSDKVWRVDFVDEIDKRYINLFLKSNYGRKEIESRATGNQLSMRNISQKLFQDIVIPLPPYKEQKAIADEIERLFHLSEQVKQQRHDTEIDLAQLDQSILAKAFRGELVPQDPNDEPAAVLLDRIRAEREQLGSSKKRAKATA